MGVGHVLLRGASDEVEDGLLGHDLGHFPQAPARVRRLSMPRHTDSAVRQLLPEVPLCLKAIILKVQCVEHPAESQLLSHSLSIELHQILRLCCPPTAFSQCHK